MLEIKCALSNREQRVREREREIRGAHVMKFGLIGILRRVFCSEALAFSRRVESKFENGHEGPGSKSCFLRLRKSFSFIDRISVNKSTSKMIDINTSMLTSSRKKKYEEERSLRAF